MLSLTDLKSIIQGDVPKDIKAMRDDFISYVIHVFGTGTDEYLTKINDYENDKQHKLRTDHAIPNQWIIEELTRPIDNIWQAKGGDEHYTFSGTDQSEAFRTKLLDVRGGMPMQAFVKEIWFQRFISDPNGVIFLEVDPETQKAEFAYKSIMSIRDYDVSGIKINWIVFEPQVSITEIIDEKPVSIEYFWAVDERFYYYVRNDGKDISIKEVIINTFGRVPAIVNSPIFSTDKAFKVSILEKQIPLLNSYLTKNSIKEIYQFKHNYAIFWAYQWVCPTCNGKRVLPNDVTDSGRTGSSSVVCYACNGSGFSARKDASDVLLLPKPEADIPTTIPPAGYVQPDVKTCEENRMELDWIFDKMFHSLWGTTTSHMMNDKGRNETATGRFIDTMPVYNKLNHIADIIQVIQRELTLIFGKFWYPETLTDVKISYSRRYIIEPPDAIWLQYQNARVAGAPEMALNYMLEQYYYSEFASNKVMGDYFVKLMYVEPFVHMAIEEVMNLEIEDEVKLAKLYYPMWQGEQTPMQVEGKTIEALREELKTYSAKFKLVKPSAPAPPVNATISPADNLVSPFKQNNMTKIIN